MEVSWGGVVASLMMDSGFKSVMSREPQRAHSKPSGSVRHLGHMYMPLAKIISSLGHLLQKKLISSW